MRDFAHIVTFTTAGILVLLTAVSTIPEAEAQSYQVRTLSVGRATHFLRTDRTVSATRSFMQRMSLRAHDLSGSGENTLSLHLSVRYFNDFGLPEGLREDPFAARDWNRLTLDVGYLEWRPFDALEFTARRQWKIDALGLSDFDGARIEFAGRLSPEVTGRVGAYAGRDVQWTPDSLSPTSFDVQGLPPNDPFYEDDPWPWIFGGHGGMSVGPADIDFAYERRQFDGDEIVDDLGQTFPNSELSVAEERIGTAINGNPTRSVSLGASASYHTLLAAVDRADVRASWRLPWWSSAATVGVQHRQPWFDSSSIFNLFGAQPHQSTYVTYQHPVESWSTSLETRGWGRLYHGDTDASDLGKDPDDALAVGGAAGHRTRLRLFGEPVTWTSLVSHQSSVQGEYGGDQLLADTGVRMPVWENDVFFDGRALFLWARPESSRFAAGYAGSLLLGVDARLAWGTVSLATETTSSDYFGGNFNVYGTFETEFWP